jgi:predicted CoA-binding protein
MDETIRHVLTAYTTWAVVGCSPDPWRDSHSIAALLLDRGYDVVPVTPKAGEVLGRQRYPTLQDAVDDGHAIEVVDVFRAPTRPACTSTRRSRSARRRCGCSSGVVDPARPPALRTRGWRSSWTAARARAAEL